MITHRRFKAPQATRPLLALIASVALFCTSIVQAQPAHNMNDMNPMHNSSTASPAGGLDMKSLMKNMSDQMSSMPMSGDPDVDFAMMMRIHHLGAVDMAKVQLRDGKNPQMRKMANDIIAAQNKEIAIFDKFLAVHGHGMDQMKK